MNIDTSRRDSKEKRALHCRLGEILTQPKPDSCRPAVGLAAQTAQQQQRQHYFIAQTANDWCAFKGVSYQLLPPSPPQLLQLALGLLLLALGLLRLAHLETRHRGEPSCKALGVLRCHASCCTVCPAEDYGAGDLPCRHVVVLGGRVDNLVNGLHGEVEGHELHNGSQPLERRAHADAGEASLHARGAAGLV